ncbi:CONSTANS-like zinc finger protein [Quillaja saponaria]|uniref:CONSTANS-like zinc finger protein n=1 Tax=Quillaja saponaria TaxID=32244 RepID=A0AAD7M7P0_QUISA|nr:CONSTANS-like zinc finger protein [Quillaja saponaria]
MFHNKIRSHMFIETKAAIALGGKTARACVSCLRKRAHWYCAADDAFLCHGCDKLVHTANQLASRHERVQLETASSSTVNCSVTRENKPPAWHCGVTRKARTPRHRNKALLVQQQEQHKVGQSNISSTLPVVPELGNEEQVLDENDEQLLLFRVPVLDPFDAELCNIYDNHEVALGDERVETSNKKKEVAGGYGQDDETCDLNNFSGFLPSDIDLAEFAADVESLLCKGPTEDDFNEMKESKMFDNSIVKVKNEEGGDDDEALMDCHLETMFDMTSEALNWNFDSESPAMGDEEEEKLVVPSAAESSDTKLGMKRKVFLRLNYEDVITSWASQCSPWTTGIRLKSNPDDCWPDYLGTNADVQVPYSNELGALRRHLAGGAGEGREARVLRYREKRRTRLFAKKIRYEVRKLNAEKRPRMKGRFVKRTSFMGATSTFPDL